ncbi:MAG: FecR family protein [Candidatus Marinimicrobia bacterium]|jgi:ferric-dicitrate binding protein FerR (iron transport regulator)|nr:FecR family protein [Candidatus Neomarinimicrobiota bacterium]MBT3501598.1 FecR family protein [Candidatus Neomarinimicrobiota bacterium]MBT3838308.1 FecR family protein [Candidatus Neomarinimicrobiota bacterium]MBT4000150.1 FecR family protein [Candidatus Neomarinimicrobiota bacterium]MBT4281698.1 FecR family protein [Candidatus Neomarinimicrobiota bacterium]
MKKLDTIEKLIWERSAQIDLPPTPNKDEAWMRLSQQIDISDMDIKLEQEKNSPVNHTIWTILKPKLSYAIAFGLALIIALPIAYDSITTNTVVTEATDFHTMDLPDGSKVTLNAGSQIKYKKDFNSIHRSLTLVGEAYFDVQKGNIPFTIHTNRGKVTVLGTTFNVRARKDGFEVGVNSGVVTVSNDTESVTLTKGQMLNIDSEFDKTSLQKVSYRNYPDWMNKKLVFNKTPLSVVCGEIERTFGIIFKFTNPDLFDLSVTGVIDTQDLNTVLSTISFLTQHEFKFDGDICTIN